MNYNVTLPSALKFAIDTLQNASYESYAVGGFIRDYLLSRECYDYDVTTSALPQQIIDCFSNHKVIETGLKHGTVTVVIDNNNIEITTFRIDGDYSDNRHPNAVSFTAKLSDDLCRRDFSINALAYNDITGLVDLFDGIGDLKRRVISVIGDGNKRFCEDALRILRAFRFSAQLDFEIDEKTQVAVKTQAHLLGNISSERITAEFTKLLCSSNPLNVLILMEKLNVIQYILNGYYIPQKLSKRSVFTVRLVQLIDNIDAVSKLRLDKKTYRAVKTLLVYKGKEISHERIAFKQIISEVGIDLFEDIIELCCENTCEAYTLYSSIIADNDCVCISMLAIDGDDLVNIGICGKSVGEVLMLLLSEVITENLNNDKDVLLKRAKQIFDMKLN